MHSIYEERLFILFFQVEISQIAAPLAALLVPLESPSWFHNVWTCGGEVNIEYLTIFSLKIPLKQN